MSENKVFHRIKNERTQNFETAKLQFRSGEIWGYPHKPNGLFPSVKAYLEDLPMDKEGIQFTTSILPNTMTPQGVAMWRTLGGGGSPEVEERRNGEAACVSVMIVYARYKCR